MWTETRKVIRFIRNEHEARAWLSANDPVLVACQAMRRLNRHAQTLRKRNPSRTRIYEAKDRLIHWLYDNRYVVEVTLDAQNLPCWHCDENGVSHSWREWEDWGSDDHDPDGHECEWCGGTHVYRTICLYRFVVCADGHRFTLHQPESLTWGRLPLTSYKSSEYKNRESRAGDHLEADHANVLYAAVQLFLADRRVISRLALHGARDVLCAACRDIVHDVVYLYLRDWYFRCKLWLYWRKKHLRDWLDGKPRVKVTR